ncbi:MULTISPECIES: endonuclease domain-containing protein [unclassified Modestobacter]
MRDGLLTRDQLRSSAWVGVLRNVYVHRDAVVDHRLRVRAALLRVPRAVVSGSSAALLWGVPMAGDDDPVELSLPAGAHQVRIAGVRVRRRELPDGWTTRRAGLPVTTPEATAVDLAAGLPGDEGVVAVDRLVTAGTTGLAQVRALAATLSGPGARRARTVCALADGLAESPQETRLRLLVRRSGLPTPVAQHRVVHRGRFVARVDFGWPEQRVALEYDGDLARRGGAVPPRPGPAQPADRGWLARRVRDCGGSAGPGPARGPDRRRARAVTRCCAPVGASSRADTLATAQRRAERGRQTIGRGR